MNSAFRHYLDNSIDAQTIEMEVTPLDSFKQLFFTSKEADIKYHNRNPIAQNNLFDLIRSVWDVAYNYGWQDARANEGLSIEED